MNLFRKAAAAALAVCTAVTCASCGENTANAMTVGDYDVRAGIYLYYATSAFGEAIQVLRDGGETFEEATTSEDYKKIMKDKNIDGLPADEWIQNKAEEHCATFVAIEKEFEALGLTLSGEQRAAADANVASSQGFYGEFFENTGIGEQSLKDIILNSYKQDEVWKAYYGEGSDGGKEGIEEKTLYDHYKDNHLRIKYIEMPLKDGEGNLLKADGKEEIEKMAQDYLKRLGKKKNDEAALMEEFDYLIEEHANYVTSLSEAAITTTDESGNTVTTVTTLKSTSAESTKGTTKAPEDEKDTEEKPADETEDKTEDQAEAEDKTEDKAEAEDKAEDKAEDAAVTTTAAEGEDAVTTTAPAEETDAETTVTTTAAEEPAEDGTESTAAGTTATTATTEGTEETTTTTVSGLGYDTANERILAVSTSASEKEDEEKEETTTEPTYTPCEKVYNWAVNPDTDYLKPELIKDDECYYVVIKMDIEDRMTSGDLWNSGAIESVRNEMFYDKFLDKLKELSGNMQIKRNERAFKRYKVLDIDYIGYQNALMQAYSSMYGGFGG